MRRLLLTELRAPGQQPLCTAQGGPVGPTGLMANAMEVTVGITTVDGHM